MPEKHARLSPSASSRWLACPYSLRAPKLPAGPAADEGTEAHDWAEKYVGGGCMLDDVPQKFRAGAELYAQHIWANHAKPLLETFWESMEIPDFGGTIDCLLVKDNAVAVYDYKFGKWPVAAEGNTQLLCYAVLAAEHFNVDTFYGVIVQPNAFKGEKVKQAVYPAEQVADHRLRIIDTLGNDTKATGEHCRFCSLRQLGECDQGVMFGKVKEWKK